MTLFRIFSAALVVATIVLTGCATSRSELRLTAPVGSPATAERSDAPVAVIRFVKDLRRFEQAPSNPSTPSLGFEGAETAAAEVRLRAIGRKRNGYGMALGDVLLEEGQTVEMVVRDALTAALRDNGFNVVASGNATSPKLDVDVQITTFWSWIQPGFWAITVRSGIAVDVGIASKSGKTTIAVQTEDSRQLVTDSAWIEAVQKALAAFRKEAAMKFPVAASIGDT